MMRLLAIDLEYTLLLTTLNIRCTFLMLQRTVKQRTVPRRYNNIQYCTSKWMSEISEEINSLWQLDLVLIQQGSMTRQEQVYGKKTSLDPVTGKLSVPDFEELIMNTGLKLY
jgi:hypothetical protein